MFGSVPNHSGWATQDVRASGIKASTIDGGWPALSEGPSDAATAAVRAEYAEAKKSLHERYPEYEHDLHFRQPYLRGYHEVQREIGRN